MYVDPDKKMVVGKVEWSRNGNVQAMERPVLPEPPEEAGTTPRRRPHTLRKLYYPWCTYRTAKRVFFVDGKFKDTERHRPLEEAIEKALHEPYWND